VAELEQLAAAEGEQVVSLQRILAGLLGLLRQHVRAQADKPVTSAAAESDSSGSGRRGRSGSTSSTSSASSSVGLAIEAVSQALFWP
jgi:hypothetical protein